MKRTSYFIIFLLISITNLYGQQTPLSQQMAATAMHLWKDSLVVGSSKDGKAQWVYQESVYLRGWKKYIKPPLIRSITTSSKNMSIII